MDFKKLSKNLFFAFLFLLPFQTVYLLREPMIDGAKWQYGVIAIYGTDIVLLLSIISFIASRSLKMQWQSIKDARCKMQDKTAGWMHPSCIIHHAPLILIVLLLWSGLSIFWAPDQALAGYFFVKLLLGASVFFLARSLDGRDVKTAVKVLLVAAMIQGMIGIGQFVFQESVSSSFLGMSAHESWQAGTSVLKLEEGRLLRAYGSFPHPNILGGFLAIILVIAIADFRFQIADLKKRNHSAFLILILLALILTFSRAAWLGVVLSIAFFAIYFYHKTKPTGNIISRPWNYDTFFKTMFVLGIAATVFVFVLRDQVFPRFDAATIVGEGSVSERVVSLADAKALIVANPIAGVGAGNFTTAIIGNEPSRPVWSIQPAHDVFALVFAELGVVGLVLFLSFVVAILYGVIPSLSRNLGILLFAQNDKRERVAPQNQPVIFTIAFLALLPSLLLDHWLWSSHFGVLFLFLLLGLVCRTR